MKIASRLHNRDGSPRLITIHGKLYTFHPVQDKFGDTHMVADVHNEDHAAVLLGGDSDAFYAYGADLQIPPPKPKLAPAKAGGDTGDAGTGDAGKDNDHTVLAFPFDVMNAAEVLLNGSASAIGADVGKVKPAVVRAALAIELASNKPRKTVIDLLTKTVEGMIDAGVTD